jgi:hypothetical protein
LVLASDLVPYPRSLASDGNTLDLQAFNRPSSANFWSSHPAVEDEFSVKTEWLREAARSRLP